MVNCILARWLWFKLAEGTKKCSLVHKLSFIGCIEAEICLFLINLPSTNYHNLTHSIENVHNQEIKPLAFIICKIFPSSLLRQMKASLYLRVSELRFNKMFGELLSEKVTGRFGSQLYNTADVLDTEEWMKYWLEFMVLVIVDAFEQEKKQIPVVLVERFISLSAKLIISCLDMYLSNRVIWWKELIQGPSIGGMGDRVLCLLQFEKIPADHPSSLGSCFIMIPLSFSFQSISQLSLLSKRC
ncbi:phenylalanine ammonia-lyase [Puccinia sorghi]|uniref:Phenylalanine ammonia-lyase n=1 Tax=Puccinia sorghi TaxID=27349 RepID=A0A0L6UU23_9BASI|nr:phenylalanine ammonia-lyase [Puccinia sorghi]